MRIIMRSLSDINSWRIEPISGAITTAIQSPDPHKVFVGSPSILVLNNKRIIISCDYQGPGLGKIKGKKGKSNRTGHWIQGQIAVSRDGGDSWDTKTVFPTGNATLFSIDTNIYLVSYANGLQITYSGDGGENWSKPESITPHNDEFDNFEGGRPAVLVTDNSIYILAFCLPDKSLRGNVNDKTTPVILQATRGSNLLSRKSWQIHKTELTLPEYITADQYRAVGAPVFNIPACEREHNLGNGRWAAHPGWSHPRLIQISNRRHPWQNHEKSAIHMLTRAALHRSNCAILGRINSTTPAGQIISHQATPAGSHFSLLPLPGGHLPFALIYDDKSELFWLISNPAANSLIPPRNLPRQHSGLPSEQRHSLQLHFSCNLVDWSFAALLAQADTNNFSSIHEPDATISGETLHITTRASDSNAKNQHDSNFITYFSIQDFRQLAY